jgi:hypothetical protein
MATDHDCLEHLVYQDHSWVETHGLDCGPFEQCWQEWWACPVCGEQFTAAELVQELARKERINDADVTQ